MTKDFANNFHAHADFEKTTTVQVKLLQFLFSFFIKVSSVFERTGR